MNFLIIQEAGRHEKNKNFRESLSLCKSICKIEGNQARVWGRGYPDEDKFDDYLKWADAVFVLENYFPDWLPILKIQNSKKLKIYWSIDSHCVLSNHVELCEKLKIDIHLNSTEYYLRFFTHITPRCYWFPNAYPSDLMYPLNLNKSIDIGFCGNILNRGDWIDSLNDFNIKKDIFVIGDEMVKAINTYKIHFNRNIANDINYRTFETLGCKTFILTNYTEGLEKLFDLQKDLVVYTTKEDLKEKVKYYLANPNKRKEIEESGYQTALKRHTYDSRAKYLMRIVAGCR
jgi:glycosyltransferase involved in cell wall biosynthesis